MCVCLYACVCVCVFCCLPCLARQILLSVRMKTEKENLLFFLLYFFVIEMVLSYMYNHAASAIYVEPNRRPQDDQTCTSPPVRKEMCKHKNTSLNEIHLAPPRKFETIARPLAGQTETKEEVYVCKCVAGLTYMWNGVCLVTHRGKMVFILAFKSESLQLEKKNRQKKTRNIWLIRRKPLQQTPVICLAQDLQAKNKESENWRDKDIELSAGFNRQAGQLDRTALSSTYEMGDLPIFCNLGTKERECLHVSIINTCENNIG